MFGSALFALGTVIVWGCKGEPAQSGTEGNSLRNPSDVQRYINERGRDSTPGLVDDRDDDLPEGLVSGRLEIGERVPDYEVTTIGGRHTNFEDLRAGRPMVLYVTGRIFADKDIDDQLKALVDLDDELGDSIAIIVATYGSEINVDYKEFPIVLAPDQLKQDTDHTVPRTLFSDQNNTLIWKLGSTGYEEIGPLAKSVVESQQLDPNVLGGTLLPYDIDSQYADIDNVKALNNRFVRDTAGILSSDVIDRIQLNLNAFEQNYHEQPYEGSIAFNKLLAAVRELKEQYQKKPSPILRSVIERYGSVAYLYLHPGNRPTIERYDWFYLSPTFNPDISINVNYLTDEQRAQRALISKEHRPSVSDFTFENANGEVETLTNDLGKVRLLIFVNSVNIQWAADYCDSLIANTPENLDYEAVILVEEMQTLPASLPILNNPNARFGLNSDPLSHANDFQRSGTPHLSITDRDADVANVHLFSEDFNLMPIMLEKVIEESR